MPQQSMKVKPLKTAQIQSEIKVIGKDYIQESINPLDTMRKAALLKWIGSRSKT